MTAAAVETSMIPIIRPVFELMRGRRLPTIPVAVRADSALFPCHHVRQKNR
jgi:hypothetical protein